jgi:hypothetical protein
MTAGIQLKKESLIVILERLGAKMKTDPTSHQTGCPTTTNPQLTETKIWSRTPDGGLTPTLPAQPTVGRNITFTLS